MLLCSLAAIPCVPAVAPVLFIESVDDTVVSFQFTGIVPAEVTGFIFYYGTTPGGPYPNSQSFSIAQLANVSGLTPNTHYYFVAKFVTTPGCLSPASGEVNATTSGPTLASHILTEGGDILATEDSRELVTES